MHNSCIKIPTNGTHILVAVVATHRIVKEIQQTLWHNVSIYHFGPHTSTTLPANIGSIWKMRHSLKKWPPECFPLHVWSYTDAWPAINVFTFAATLCLWRFQNPLFRVFMCQTHICFSIRISAYEIKIS